MGFALFNQSPRAAGESGMVSGTETQRELIPMPPEEYMALVCGDLPPEDLEDRFTEIGLDMADRLRRQGMLGPDVRLLDIGCGCGRVARCLIGQPLASYVGFDRHPGMFSWCTENITAVPQVRVQVLPSSRALINRWTARRATFRPPASASPSATAASRACFWPPCSPICRCPRSGII